LNRRPSFSTLAKTDGRTVKWPGVSPAAQKFEWKRNARQAARRGRGTKRIFIQMKSSFSKNGWLALLLSLLSCPFASAQFLDDFNSVQTDPAGVKGWLFRAGDGTATLDFRQGGEGYASIFVDATHDRRGIWWALLEHKVSSGLDLSRLKEPGMKLRIETRIRVSEAPRRVNLQLFTQRTTNYHSHLMEFDIPDTNNWHVLSWTPPDLDVRPGDTVMAHMALMDWGLEKYRVDVDYIKIDVVNTATAGPDQGAQVPYHPQLADPRSFTQQAKVAQDSVIDVNDPDVNLNNWHVRDGARKINLLSVNAGQYVILRWDLSAFAGRQVADHGLLELTTHSVERCSDVIKDFGLIRVVEILGGDPAWEQKTVTTGSLCKGQPLNRVLNTQMIIDWPVTEGDGGKTYLTISKTVLQRMIDGKTTGIAIKPLGAIHAGFYSMENDGGKDGAKLLFNLRN
jgi:hypothetical protein